MRVVLVHHADAVAPHIDAQRPLSAHGRVQAGWLAAQAKVAGVQPGAIWHSGKLRARQTAEAFLQLSPFAEFKMVRGLLPDDPPEFMREAIAGELLSTTRDLVLVGHMPNIVAVARLLSGGASDTPQHGLVALERQGDSGVWTETFRAAAP